MHKIFCIQAKLLFESVDIEMLFDPNLGNDYDIDQMERMLLVTKLCLHWHPQHRPKASQVGLRFQQICLMISVKFLFMSTSLQIFLRLTSRFWNY